MGSGNLDRTRTHQEIETQVEKEISKEEESENQIAEDGIGKEDAFIIDNVCPICFDRFTIPCRTNCGHWYCGSCILEFWEFGPSIRPCKCPLCSCKITNLVPVISQHIGPEEDVIMVVQKVRQYNSLYIRGVRGFFLGLRIVTPHGPSFQMDLLLNALSWGKASCIVNKQAVVLPLLYETGEFEFIPTGGLGIPRMFDVGTNVLIFTFLIICIWRKWAARGRARRLAVLRTWHA
ncbi:RING/U-box superfamily protein [Abeliophyllum distichum]|uniref:RING/U-box superfamily protein n=1 Tax=Abeliophyllum distichum TaxID=126358 RepID=A0ABD1P9H5_9LAMI